MVTGCHSHQDEVLWPSPAALAQNVLSNVFIIIREIAKPFEERQQFELINRMFYNSRS